MKNFDELLNNRGNVTQFKSTALITVYDIERILNQAIQSPSGWNLQHWKFIVFHTKESKQKLLPVAYNQNQIVDSSVVIAVLADTEADRNFGKVYYPLYKDKVLDGRVVNILYNQVRRSYENRENAIEHAYTNAAMSAITLVYSAESLGFDTGIIGGFDKDKFKEKFDISDRYIPLVLIPIGKQNEKSKESRRLDIKESTTWI